MDQFETGQETAEVLNVSEVLRDCVLCGVVAVDGRRRICTFNAGAEKLTGLNRQSVLGQSADVLPAGLRALVEESLALRIPVENPRLVLTDLNPPVVLKAATSPYRSSVGDEGTIVVLHDLGGAQKLGLSMQRLDRLASIGTLSASMAHEIRNALVAVSTFVQDLAERNKDSELSGVVGRELRRIDTILSQMLRFTGPARPASTRLSLHRILDQSLHLVQPQLESKQLGLRRSFSADQDMVKGDEYQLEQAFLNILLNAVAAMEAQGKLSVATQKAKAGTSIEIAISDTGVGIAADVLPRIFEPFFSTKPQGTGLGLAITRRIVLEHGGTIAVTSELHVGTTFRMTLPLDTAHS